MSLINLEKEVTNHAGEQVFFSFTTDPYQPLEEELGLTRQAIGILNAFGVGVNILTKGGFRAVRDLHLLSRSPRNAFGVTLTTDDPVEAQYWEKGAALPHERIASLRMAKEMGIYTWVSFEPVINPMAVFRLINEIKDFVDMVKVGKLNYFPRAAQEVDWGQFHAGVTHYLASLQLKYYIKKDLAERAKHQGGNIERLREPDCCPSSQPSDERSCRSA
ncbi:hypothetical protein [Geoalkalibacter halelectricus]|uniref:hypothetical protein n=1 Tax=Geoalkalibacter halelectricus TaxID=2847045 RepID=UPI00267055AB|nr:hypothetical protein [Geoalkalibacter halelectricus]MDO3380452.1 hypothetical protein [Geoalkalibacter halelectricus]